jgi:hypothetical protein
MGKIPAILGSRRFFYGVLLFFVLESLWVAFSARYPMAFDEDFHVGIIKIYSHQWLPFLPGQPENGNPFGALATDPSYLYHYLMSFLYRLLAAVTDNQMVQIIGLRLLNIPMVAIALVLFRRLLLRAGVSAAYTHTALAVFVLIPILPLLSGQINYDNLLLPLIAGMCLLAFEIYRSFLRQRVPLVSLLLLAAVCLTASLVKYAFLPMAMVTFVFVLIGLWRGFYGRGGKALPAACITAFRSARRPALWVLVAAVVVLSGLWLQRYGVNVVKYHTPVPACDAVLDEADCSEYGPWVRNYELAQAKGDVNESRLAYTWHWLQALHYRLFFMVNGPYDNYRNYPPMPLPSATAVLLAVSGLVAVVLYFRRLFKGQPLLVYLAVMALFYGIVLWVEDYSQFIETGQPVAINGRYLLPILLPVAAVLGRALHLAFSATPRAKAWAAALVIVLFLQGGGVFSFILRSDARWYWPGAAVWHANNAAQHVISPFIITGSKYYQ